MEMALTMLDPASTADRRRPGTGDCLLVYKVKVFSTRSFNKLVEVARHTLVIWKERNICIFWKYFTALTMSNRNIYLHFFFCIWLTQFHKAGWHVWHTLIKKVKFVNLVCCLLSYIKDLNHIYTTVCVILFINNITCTI